MGKPSTAIEPKFRAIYKGARMSARKVRLVADLVRGMYADEALDTLKFQPQRGARFIEKTLKSAVGNATDSDQTKGRSYRIEELVVTDLRVDGGPMFKRIRPRSRGSAHTILKRSCHITVGLTPIDEI
jgi:large subunit ribosomal protein L22